MENGIRFAFMRCRSLIVKLGTSRPPRRSSSDASRGVSWLPAVGGSFRRAKNVQLQLLRDVLNGLLRPNSAAEFVERRRESDDGHFAGHNRHDLAAHAGLGR